jgi:hypothetical protein
MFWRPRSTLQSVDPARPTFMGTSSSEESSSSLLSSDSLAAGLGAACGAWWRNKVAGEALLAARAPRLHYAGAFDISPCVQSPS